MSKEEQQHTAPPWHYQGWDDTPGDRGAYILGGGSENSAEEYLIAAALPLPITNRSECEANARFIVRAVNAHDALVEAVKGVSIMLNTELQKYESEPWAQRVRSAIALAEES